MTQLRLKLLYLAGAIACTAGQQAFAGTAAAPAGQPSPMLTTLVDFAGANGSSPESGVIFTAAGNLVGTTFLGGIGGQFGDGTVYQLSGADHRTLQTLVFFDGSNGSLPPSTLSIDAAGVLYGTTATGGTSNDGTAFMLQGPAYTKLVTLASFDGTNGSGPNGGLLPSGMQRDLRAKVLFGGTDQGGKNDDGTVFELTGAAHQTLTVLRRLNFANGKGVDSPLISDAAGHLYGTTAEGGGGRSVGTVFELSGPHHLTLTVLARFAGNRRGNSPLAGLAMDAAGNLYGTNSGGGAGGLGTIFELSGADHRIFTVLASFKSGDTRGSEPLAGLLIDKAGNLYGTLSADGHGGNGSIFELAADHQTFTVLHRFAGTDGSEPEAPLVADADGNLYGTTFSGGANGDGVVFELSGTGFVTAN